MSQDLVEVTGEAGQPIVVVWYETPESGSPMAAQLNGATTAHLAMAARMFWSAAALLEGANPPAINPGGGWKGGAIEVTADTVGVAVHWDADGQATGVLSFGVPPTPAHFHGAALLMDELARNEVRQVLVAQDVQRQRQQAARQRILDPGGKTN